MRFSDFVEINPAVKLRKGLTYPFIAMEDVAPGRRYVSPQIERVYRGGGAKFLSGDTLFARITPCLENGKIAQFLASDSELGFGSTEFFVFRHREGISDPGYVFYLAYTNIVRKPAEKSMVGASGRQRADLASIRYLDVPAPPLATQRKIAAILSTYDNLIENNLRRIKILEEMAQLVYREWFVKFRFPGHENVRMAESEMGPIPEGWKVRNVTDVPCFRFVCENVTPYEGVKKYFATADVRGIEIVGEGITYTFEKKPSRAQKQPPVDSVWFARMKDTYKVLVFTDVNKRWAKECMLSSGFAGFQASDKGWLGYLYCTIKSDAFHEEKNRYCTGATQMSLTNEGLKRIQVLAPDHRTAIAFNQFTAPGVNEILVLQALNAVLRLTRDLLLPKLISGELDVSELDIDVREEPA